jgi:uncharacterized lipoprotein YmbA
MKTKTREIVIRSLEFKECSEKGNENFYVIETHAPLNLNAMQFTIIESVKVPERLDEFMVLHGVGQSEILEFLNKNYKKQ